MSEENPANQKMETVLLGQMPLEILVQKTSAHHGLENRCAYCGDWFECRDHLIPRAFLRVYRDYRRNETVHCCALCNQLAGSIVAYSISEKAVYLMQQYERKYKFWIELPAWSKIEIKQLRGSLKQRIYLNEAFRRLVVAKIRNLDLVSLGMKPIPIERCIGIFV